LKNPIVRVACSLTLSSSLGGREVPQPASDFDHDWELGSYPWTLLSALISVSVGFILLVCPAPFPPSPDPDPPAVIV